MKKTLTDTQGRTYLEGDPFPKAKVYTSLKKVQLQSFGCWRRLVGCLVQSWSSVTGQVENKPLRYKWAVAGEWAHRNCQDTTVGCEIWVCDICWGTMGRWPLAQTLRLLPLGMWLGKCTTKCLHVSTPLINHAAWARTNKTLRLYRRTRKRSSFSCSLSLSPSTGKA